MTLKMFRVYRKVNKAIDSCTTLHHYLSVHNLIYNFGKMYGFNKMRTKLDIKANNMIKEMIDQQNYKNRRKTLNDY